ncbi:hypothetical protein CO178_01940, partial [candidate division WWE3 bacterium CG_4_9_14_3_um_filter_34_6]
NLSIIKTLLGVYLITISIIAIQIYYILINYKYLSEEIPLFFTLPWGEIQLANKELIWIPVISTILIFVFNLIMSVIEHSKSNISLAKFYAYSSLLSVAILAAYAAKIANSVSTINIQFPIWIKIILIPMIASLLTTAFITPFVIKFAKKYNFMDDPLRHKHPGMLLKRPIARAGGLAFLLGILIPSIVLLPILTSQKLIGILLGATICVITGLKDDKKDINPYIRLVIQGLTVSVVVLSGIILIYIPNPFGNAIKLDDFKFVINFLGEHKVYYFSALASAIWIAWTMNFMSLSNGTDGVYAGLVTVSSLVIAILMMRTLSEDPGIAIFIKLAALTAGAGLGMAIFTWPPNKLLWGFGATSAGLIIAALSILGSTKVATTLIVLIIPFIDAVFAVVRRIRRGQMPFWGDREHLHHKLLEGLGWSKQKVAIFYWTTTIVLGLIGILTSGQIRALSLAAIACIVIFGISMLNIGKRKRLIKGS